MKIKTVIIALFCLMLVTLQGSMLVSAKMGHIRFHVFKDLDRDKVFDKNEPSPPITKIHFIIQDSNFHYSRFRLVGLRGDVTFWRVPYPFNYRLTAQYDHPRSDGLGLEIWGFDSSLPVNQENVRTTVYIPLTCSYIP